MNYYNEFDPKAAAWLRELIRDGLIPDGRVDERSICDVRADELSGFVQCHFFAGISGWAYALRLAGVHDDRPLWTGSCPCQPFSSAGKQMGNTDSRHLFPAFRRLIARCNPAVVLGEQVASRLGREWLARVRLEMATLGYATRAADLCAASIGAPHIRQRLYWVADATGERRTGFDALLRAEGCGARGAEAVSEITGSGATFRLADADGARSEGTRRTVIKGWAEIGVGGGDAVGRLGNPDDPRPQGRGLRSGGDAGQRTPWSSGTILLPCADGKARRIKPGIQCLVAGLPRGVVPGGDPGIEEAQASGEARVMRLRGYGNAIVPQLAAAFIRAACPELFD